MRSALFAIALGTVLAACGGDSSTGHSEAVNGTFTLRTVNGSNLPFTLLEFPDYKLEITSDVLTLRPDGTFSDVATFRETDAGTVTTPVVPTTGTYTRSGNTITMRDSDGDTLIGTINGDAITVLIEDAFSAVYRRQ